MLELPETGQRETLKAARARLSTNRLLRAAAELIAERGYERATLAAIGTRAGYSHGLVTRRFGSKDGLLEALLNRMIDEWHEREVAPALSSSPGRRALEHVLEGIRASAARDPGAMRALYILMFEGLQPSPEVLHSRMQSLHRKQRRLIERTVARGIADGSVSPEVGSQAAAILITSALRGAAYQWVLDPEFDFDAALQILLDYIENSLAPKLVALDSTAGRPGIGQ